MKRVEMDNKINGLVYESVGVKEGKNWEGKEVFEFRFIYSSFEQNAATSVVVIDREAARDLAFHLMDLFLYGETNG